MSDNYDIEKEREKVKKLISSVLNERDKKISLKNIKIINFKDNKEIISGKKNDD